MPAEAAPITAPAAPVVKAPAESLARWVVSDKRAMALVAALGANLLVNVVDIVPVLGPIVELVSDIGFETIVLLLATSILRRDKKPLKALVALGGMGIAKIALDAFNLLPEVGSVLETLGEAGLDLTQLWFLKELIRPRGAPPLLPPGSDR